jgi:flagellar basal body-associated protein FliL
MKKKTKIILVTLICSLVLSIAAVYGIVQWMFKAQYNSNGVSHFLVVTIDKEQGKEYLGDLENHKVYIEGFNISETNFRNIKAENVSIKEALEKKLVSIDEWKKYAFSVEKSGKVEILKFDNYEIYIDTEVCIIRPLTK